MRDIMASARVIAALLIVLISATDARAQLETERSYLQLGLGVIPGIGVQAAYVQTRALYTLEGASYVDFSPRFAGGEGSIQLSGGVGGALRLLGIARALGSPAYTGTDADFGFRLGPALFFPLGESSRAENPFSLFLEPYGRFSTEISPGRVAFVEIGLQRPIIRGGLVLQL